MEAWNSLIVSGSALVLLSPASLPLPSFLMWKREFTGRMTLTRSWVGVGCLDLRASHVHHQLRRPAKLSFDNLSRWCSGGLLDLLTLRSAKVRAGTLGLAPSSRSYLMVGRGSINTCSVRDDVRVLLVLWYIEVHMDKEEPLGTLSVTNQANSKFLAMHAELHNTGLPSFLRQP